MIIRDIGIMKKLFGLIVLCALTLLCASCQEDITAEIDANEVKVSFSVKTDVLQTKAIADASNIDILHWEIYPEDIENAAAPLMKSFVRKQEGQDEFHLELTLVSQQKYNFVFWAQVEREEGKEHYDISDLRNVRIKSYKDELANDESRAAFFAYRTFDLTDPLQETVILRRPFSQLNFGAETYDISSLNLSQALKVEHSQVTVTGLGKSFNTIDGIGQGDTTVTFAKAPTPNGDVDATEKKLVVNDNSYYWLGMNYLIVNGESDNVNVDMTFHTNHGDVSLAVDNVPVKENYRTNIIGNLLTSEATFKIVVDERFRQPDIIVDEEGDTGGSGLPSMDFYITEDGDDLIYTVYTFEGLEEWRQAAHQDALDDTDRRIHLVLGADIIVEYIDGEPNWTPVGTYEHPYDGTVDGAGHYISNLSIDTEDGPAGFIGAWSGEDGAIAAQNLTFRDIHINSSNGYGTGAVIGYGHKRYVIKNCHVKGGSISGIGGGPVGGLFGGGFESGFGGNNSGFGGMAIDCSTSASIITSIYTYYVGGIGGFGSAVNCTNRGSIHSQGYYIGGIVGGSRGNVNGNENYGKLTGGTYVGGIVGGLEDGELENNSNYGDVYGSEEDKLGGIYGYLGETASQGGNVYQCVVKVIVIDQDYTVKQEKEVTTYTVYTAEGLEAWRAAALQNALDKKSDMVNLLLAADIELPEVEEGNSNWTPLGTTSNPYNGFVDGGGYTISNLTIVGTDNVGFIGVASIDDAVAVKNLKLANVKISGNKNVAAIVGQVTNDGEVENCHVLSGAVVGTGNYVAGILGYTDVYGCVYNSSNAADISGASYVGGVSGRARTTSCENRGNITGTGSNVGGVYGLYTYGSTSYNNNYGKVSGHNNVGGIAGNGSSSYSYNEGDVVGNDYVAGIVASLSTNISELGASVNKGNVKGRNYVAGILAESRNSIGDCTNEGRIEGRMYVAGIVAHWYSRTGYSNNILARCENKGDVTGISYVSGLVSYLTGTYNCNIVNNTNNASVTGEDKVAAFLAYNENSNVINNTNTGDITGYFDVAHFVAAFNKSYSPDTVTGNVSTGELRILQNNDYKRTFEVNAVSYVVYTQKGFEAWAAEARQCVEDGYACNLTLETDVVLAVPSSDESNWTPLGTENKKFKGDIDARNHCIYNLTIKDSRDGMGFIGYISSGSIKNLKLANVNIVQSTTNNYNYVGAVAAYSTVAIENCHVLSGTIVGLDDWVGGISGYCEKTITNCTNYASITGAELGYSTNGYVGGIVGEGKVAQCENFGNVTGYMRYTGGCTGEGNASECKNHGDVTQCGKNRYVGGISGYGTVEQSENKGTVSGYSYVGGLTGRGNVTYSVNSGDVIGTYSNIGEYTGNGTAQGCTNTGTVTGAN